MNTSNICKTCIGVGKCNKYCILQAGINLTTFLSNVDFVKTEIGELKGDGRDSKLTLIVSGHIIDSSPLPAILLSDLTTSISATGKLSPMNGVPPQQVLKTYLDTLDMSQEQKDKLIQDFKLINSNKILPKPLKIGMECEVDYEAQGSKKTATTSISIIRWQTNKQTGKLECEICCELDKGVTDQKKKWLSVPITEYGKSFRIPYIERTLKSSELDRELICMTDVGFIKPIVISDGKVKLAIDGQCLYKVSNDTAVIIGKFGQNGKMVDIQNGMSQVLKTKAYKKIANGLNYIERHKRFIVPYGLFEVNYIQL